MRPPPGSERLNHAGWWASQMFELSMMERDEAEVRRLVRRELTFDAVQRWSDDPASRYWALGAGVFSERPSSDPGSKVTVFEMGFPAVLRPETLPQRPDGSFDWGAYQETAYPTGVPVTLDPSVPPRCSALSHPLSPRAGEAEVRMAVARTIGEALKVWAADSRSVWWVPRGYDVEMVPGAFTLDAPSRSVVRVRLRLESLVDRPPSPGSLSRDWTTN